MGYLVFVEYQRSKRKIDHYQNQISEGDKIIRELRAREDDTNEAIKSKDTQLAILRVRLNEVDTELRDKRNELESLKNESDRILKDHSSISDVQSQAFETLKEKLSQLELNLQRERDGFANAQVCWL
jgi:chromosome segregation ATPase